MPHQHSEDRIYTVISGGVLHRPRKNLGSRQIEGVCARKRDRAARQDSPSPLGEVCVTQVTAYGPLDISYLESKGDPRNQRT
jgi:hypothetical protein